MINLPPKIRYYGDEVLGGQYKTFALNTYHNIIGVASRGDIPYITRNTSLEDGTTITYESVYNPAVKLRTGFIRIDTSQTVPELPKPGGMRIVCSDGDGQAYYFDHADLKLGFNPPLPIKRSDLSVIESQFTVEWSKTSWANKGYSGCMAFSASEYRVNKSPTFGTGTLIRCAAWYEKLHLRVEEGKFNAIIVHSPTMLNDLYIYMASNVRILEFYPDPRSFLVQDIVYHNYYKATLIEGYKIVDDYIDPSVDFESVDFISNVTEFAFEHGLFATLKKSFIDKGTKALPQTFYINIKPEIVDQNDVELYEYMNRARIAITAPSFNHWLFSYTEYPEVAIPANASQFVFNYSSRQGSEYGDFAVMKLLPPVPRFNVGYESGFERESDIIREYYERHVESKDYEFTKTYEVEYYTTEKSDGEVTAYQTPAGPRPQTLLGYGASYSISSRIKGPPLYGMGYAGFSYTKESKGATRDTSHATRKGVEFIKFMPIPYVEVVDKVSTTYENLFAVFYELDSVEASALVIDSTLEEGSVASLTPDPGHSEWGRYTTEDFYRLDRTYTKELTAGGTITLKAHWNGVETTLDTDSWEIDKSSESDTYSSYNTDNNRYYIYDREPPNSGDRIVDDNGNLIIDDTTGIALQAGKRHYSSQWVYDGTYIVLCLTCGYILKEDFVTRYYRKHMTFIFDVSSDTLKYTKLDYRVDYNKDLPYLYPLQLYLKTK